MTRYTKTKISDKYDLPYLSKGDHIQILSTYLRSIWNKTNTSFDRLPRRRRGIIHVVQLLHQKFRGASIKGITAQEALKRANINVKGLKPLTKRQRLHLNEPPEEVPEVEVLKDVSPALPCLSKKASDSSDQDIDIDIEGEDSDADESEDNSSTEEESAETMTLKSESANVDDEDMDCSSESVYADDEEMTSDLESGVGSERMSVNEASASQQATKLKNKIKITLHQPLPQEWSFSTSTAANFRIRDLGNQGISIEVEEAEGVMAI